MLTAGREPGRGGVALLGARNEQIHGLDDRPETLKHLPILTSMGYIAHEMTCGEVESLKNDLSSNKQLEPAVDAFLSTVGICEQSDPQTEVDVRNAIGSSIDSLSPATMAFLLSEAKGSEIVSGQTRLDIVVVPGLKEVKSVQDAVDVLKRLSKLVQERLSCDEEPIVMPDLDERLLEKIRVEDLLGKNYTKQQVIFASRRIAGGDLAGQRQFANEERNSGINMVSVSPYASLVRLLKISEEIENEYKDIPDINVRRRAITNRIADSRNFTMVNYDSAFGLGPEWFVAPTTLIADDGRVYIKLHEGNHVGGALAVA